MKRIKLTEKYKPYSRELGTQCLLPKSSWKATLYPRLITLVNLADEQADAIQIAPHIEGPFRQFTVMQDLDRGWIRVLGRGREGHFSYRILAAANEIILFLERSVKAGILFVLDGENHMLKRKEELIIPCNGGTFPQQVLEKVHFGCHKSPDWTLVRRRLRIDEILPIWFELGKHLPRNPNVEWGNTRFLAACRSLIEQRERREIGSQLMDLFQVGFEGMLSPRLVDNEHQTQEINEKTNPDGISPLVLLGEGAQLIRDLLVQEKEAVLEVLPCLPVELHAGRFVDIQCKGLVLNLEFSKKTIRCVNLYPRTDQTRHLMFPASIQSFRLRTGDKDRGKRCKVGEPIHLKAQHAYVLDRFQK